MRPIYKHPSENKDVLGANSRKLRRDIGSFNAKSGTQYFKEAKP